MVFTEVYDINNKLITDVDMLIAIHSTCPVILYDSEPMGYDEFVALISDQADTTDELPIV